MSFRELKPESRFQVISQLFERVGFRLVSGFGTALAMPSERIGASSALLLTGARFETTI